MRRKIVRLRLIFIDIDNRRLFNSASLSNGELFVTFTKPIVPASALSCPRIDAPFLTSFMVPHGPPGLLGRFFLSADSRLSERGITLRFISFDAYAELADRNADNWGSFNPMFDPRVSDVPHGSMCLAGFDQRGVIKICACAKPIDASQKSFAEIVNAGGFAAIRPDRNIDRIETTIDAAFAYEMRGLLAYLGAIWVHPDARGDRFASIFAYTLNACIMTLWNPDYLVGSVKHTTAGTALFRRYGYEHEMSSLHISLRGKPETKLTIMYMNAQEFLHRLARYLDEIWPEIDAAIASRNRQQSA